ncbi:MAG: metallophosphoesterase [Lactobacillales bacterium]|nr:metallophosphoesterase [Lactobacillales bacterium]
MKAIIVSDNHGNQPILQEIVEKYSGQVDAFFHTGDAEWRASDADLAHHFIAVAGNNDWYYELPDEEIVEVKGFKVLLTHGHRHNVYFGINHLRELAQRTQVDIVLFGHIHQQVAQYIDDVLFVNPGSISYPRGQRPRKSYAILEATSEKYTVTFIDEKHEPIKEMRYEFVR